MAVAGALHQSGGLTVKMLNGFVPAVGSEFEIVSGYLLTSFFPANIPNYTTLLYTNQFSSGATLANAGVYLDVVSPAPAQVLAPQLAGGNFSFGFRTLSNQSYTLLASTNLVAGTWSPVTNFTGNGSLWNVALPVTPAVPQVF